MSIIDLIEEIESLQKEFEEHFDDETSIDRPLWMEARLKKTLKHLETATLSVEEQETILARLDTFFDVITHRHKRHLEQIHEEEANVEKQRRHAQGVRAYNQSLFEP